MKQNRPEPRADRVGGGGGVGVFPSAGSGSLVSPSEHDPGAGLHVESFSTSREVEQVSQLAVFCRGRFRLSQTVHRDSAGAAEQAR